MFLLKLLAGIVVGVAVVAGVVVVLSMMGTPRPSCADGAVTRSAAADASFGTKWSAFDAALKRGEAATVSLSEEELASRGARYLAETNVPAKDLEIHLCPGQGKGQASLKMAVLGRDVSAVATGHLEVASSPPRIVVDGLQQGVARARMVEALAELPAEWREALIARYVEEQPVEEIARRLGRSYKATESLLSRARAKMRDRLSSIPDESL